MSCLGGSQQRAVWRRPPLQHPLCWLVYKNESSRMRSQTQARSVRSRRVERRRKTVWLTDLRSLCVDEGTVGRIVVQPYDRVWHLCCKRPGALPAPPSRPAVAAAVRGCGWQIRTSRSAPFGLHRCSSDFEPVSHLGPLGSNFGEHRCSRRGAWRGVRFCQACPRAAVWGFGLAWGERNSVMEGSTCFFHRICSLCACTPHRLLQRELASLLDQTPCIFASLRVRIHVGMSMESGGLAHPAGDSRTGYRASFLLPAPSLDSRTLTCCTMMWGLRKDHDVNPTEAHTYFRFDRLLPETLAECTAGSSDTALAPCGPHGRKPARIPRVYYKMGDSTNRKSTRRPR